MDETVESCEVVTNLQNLVYEDLELDMVAELPEPARFNVATAEDVEFLISELMNTGCPVELKDCLKSMV